MPQNKLTPMFCDHFKGERDKIEFSINYCAMILICWTSGCTKKLNLLGIALIIIAECVVSRDGVGAAVYKRVFKLRD